MLPSESPIINETATTSVFIVFCSKQGLAKQALNQEGEEKIIFRPISPTLLFLVLKGINKSAGKNFLKIEINDGENKDNEVSTTNSFLSLFSLCGYGSKSRSRLYLSLQNNNQASAAKAKKN